MDSELLSNKRYQWIILAFGAACILTFFIALRLNIKAKRSIHESGERIIGTLYDVGPKYFKVRYQINGKTYSYATKEPFQYLRNGEQFTIAYLTDEPEQINIYYDQPRCDTNEVITVKCNSISKTASILTFKYTANGRTYTRETRYKDDQSLSTSDYVVEHLRTQPEIGYLVSKR